MEPKHPIKISNMIRGQTVVIKKRFRIWRRKKPWAEFKRIDHLSCDPTAHWYTRSFRDIPARHFSLIDNWPKLPTWSPHWNPSSEGADMLTLILHSVYSGVVLQVQWGCMILWLWRCALRSALAVGTLTARRADMRESRSGEGGRGRGAWAMGFTVTFNQTSRVEISVLYNKT